MTQVLCLFALCLPACSNLDFGQTPLSRLSEAFDSGKPYGAEGDAGGASAEVLDSNKLEQALLAWQDSQSDSPNVYSIGIGDTLKIGILALERPGEIKVLDREVGADGMISLPWVGEIQVKGADKREIAKRITEAYKDRYLKDPQVDVVVAEHRSAAVVVTGAVNGPGVHYLRRDVSSVLEVLSLAGGLARNAGPTLLIVRAKPLTAKSDEGAGDVVDEPQVSVATSEEEGEEKGEAPVPLDPLASRAPTEEKATVAGGGDSTEKAGGQPYSSPQGGGRVGEGSSSPLTAESEDEAGVDAQGEVEGGEGEGGSALSALAVLDGPGATNTQDRIEVDLSQLVNGRDIRLNVPVLPNDIVSIPALAEHFIYVMGYVRSPGMIPLPQDRRLSALNALAMSGGPNVQGRPAKCSVIREREDGRKEFIKVNVAKTARGVRPPFYMEPGDTLVVGSTLIMKMTEIFRVGGSAGTSYATPLVP